MEQKRWKGMVKGNGTKRGVHLLQGEEVQRNGTETVERNGEGEWNETWSASPTGGGGAKEWNRNGGVEWNMDRNMECSKTTMEQLSANQ